MNKSLNKSQKESTFSGAQAPVSTCELCDASSSEWKCIECNQLICSRCRKIHSRGSVTKKHQIIDLKDVNAGSDYTTTCDSHNSQPYQLYCKDCMVLVCNKCITETHAGHRFCEVDKVVEKKQQQLEEFVDGLRENLKSAHDEAEKFQKENRRILKKFDLAERSIEDYVQNTITEIEKCKEELIKLVTNAKKQAADNIKLCESKHESRKTTIASLINEIEKVIQSQDGIKIVQCKTVSEDKLVTISPLEITVPQFIPKYESFPIKAEDLIGKVEFESSKQPRKKSPLKKKASLVSLLSTDSAADTLTTTTIRHSFQVPSMQDRCVGCIAVQNDNEAWVACPYDQNVSLVRRNGSLTKEIQTEFNISDIALTKSGDLLVSSSESHSLKIIKDGIFHDFMDTFPSEPHGLSIAKNGDILVCLTDGDFGHVTRLSEVGKMKQEFDTYIIEQQSFLLRKPVRCVESLNGDLWILDEAAKKIVVINNKGTCRFLWEGPTSESTKKRVEPSGLDCDECGHILITDYGNDKIYIVNAESGQTEILQVDQQKHSLEDPYAIAVYSDKFIWVGCDDGRILVMRYKRDK